MNKQYSVRGGELFERIIEDNFVLDEQKCAGYMKQILRGVKYMHDNSVCLYYFVLLTFLYFDVNKNLILYFVSLNFHP